MVRTRRKNSCRILLVVVAGFAVTALLGFAGLSQVSAAQDRGRDSRGELCADAVRLTFRALDHLDATLADLVTDGTLTQDQADTVAANLIDGNSDVAGGRCAGVARSVQATMEAVSDLLGIEWTDIRERRRAGESLAEIAESASVSRDELIDAFMTGVTERLDAAEAEGRITPEERAEREDAAVARIERRIEHRHDDDGTPVSEPQ